MVDLEDLRRHAVKRILVVGDIIRDVYETYTFKKMCPDVPDAPAMIIDSREEYPGGAANVAMNIATLYPDSYVDVIGVHDYAIAQSMKRIAKGRVGCGYGTPGRVIEKVRIVKDGRVIMRLDDQNIDSRTAEDVFMRLAEYLRFENPDIIVFSDYASGTVNDDSLNLLLSHREKLLVDTKLTDLSVFGVGGRKTLAVKLNASEMQRVLLKDAQPERYFHALVVTLGADGAMVKLHHDSGDGRTTTHSLKVNGRAVSEVDVNGCGDTFIAGMVASLLSNDDMFTAAQFGNAAAATVVGRPRVAIADLKDTLALLGRENEVS